jgi:hypothetical protein
VRILKLCLLNIFLLNSGCTTFNSIKAVVPPVGFKLSYVASLKPILSWEKLENYDGDYDVVVMIEENYHFQMPFMKVVYAKNNIPSTEHKIESLLYADTVYYWSVKPSIKKTDDDWARYNFYFIAGIVNFWKINALFNFKTPELSPSVID